MLRIKKFAKWRSSRIAGVPAAPKQSFLARIYIRAFFVQAERILEMGDKNAKRHLVESQVPWSCIM
jgi:hypothetical protein